MKNILSAYTSFSNTKETDLLLEVMHDVCFTMNNTQYTIRILAADPIDAMDKTHKMSEKEVHLHKI